MFVKGKPTSCEPWNKGKKGSQVAWNKGLTKADSKVLKYIRNGHPNYNTELKGCFYKGMVSNKKGTGKFRYFNMPEWISLRVELFEASNYCCLACGKKGGKIELHHLLPVSLFPEYMFNKENVIILCRSCHTKTDTYGLSLVRKRGEFREQLSKLTLSQVREETLAKVQRLIAEAKVNDHASNANTSALSERNDIV